MGREVRQRNKQSRPAEERVAEGFVPEEEVSVTETAKDGVNDRRITVNEPGKTDDGLKVGGGNVLIGSKKEVWKDKNENEVDVVVKHKVPVGVIIAFDVFDNPVSGSEKMGRVTISVGGDVFAWHGQELSSFSKKDEVIDWLSNLLYVNTIFPNGVVFEWADIETGLE